MSARSNILSAGAAVLRREGAQGLSLRAVAKEVGVTPMAIYKHFENKDDLVDALTKEGIAAWASRLERLPRGTPGARLEGAFDAFLDFALREPDQFEAAFMLAAPAARRYPRDFHDAGSHAAAWLLGEIKRAARPDDAEKTPALEIALTLWATAQGLISIYRAKRFDGGERAFRSIYKRAMRRCLTSFRLGGSA